MQIVCNLHPICMKCQILFSRKNKKKYFNLSSAENFTQSTKSGYPVHLLFRIQLVSLEPIQLTLKVLRLIVADDILKILFLLFLEKIRLAISCESST